MLEYRTIIAGSRNYTDQKQLNQVCNWIYRKAKIPFDMSTVISGTCRGTDKMGEEFAREKGMSIAKFPADWGKYGKLAGPVRNKKMADYAKKPGCIGTLIAFVNEESKGTRDMIKRAIEAKLIVFVVDYEKQQIEKYDYKNNSFEKIF